MNKSTLFITAWNMSRDAAAKFGGSVKSYFAESLKLAYGRTRLVTLESCLKIGGKLWEKTVCAAFILTVILLPPLSVLNTTRIKPVTSNGPAWVMTPCYQ
ncbi:hypothetical protein DOE63_12530 [Salmonella enterica subsp. diarizonae serovar 59:z10:-]|nr:hypothetical protein DOE63_12530 [Salmonella enterica subsp. diarizonae serovar 59:z10:-]